MEYIFTLKYKLSDLDSDQDEIVERLGAGGCDDALVGIGQPGRIALEFTRESANADKALISALSDVRRILPSARLIEAAPDLVGLTDVADLIGVSRQNMRKLMLTHAMSFPGPVHEGASAVWHLADILRWLSDRGTYQLEQSVFDVAMLAKQINLARQAHQMTPKAQRQIQPFVQ